MTASDQPSTWTAEARSVVEKVGALEAALVVALDCDRPRDTPTWHGLAGVDEVIIGRGSERLVRRERAGGLQRLTLQLADARVSSSHARLARQAGAWVLEDVGSKNGSLINGTARRTARLADGDLLELGHTMLLYRDGIAWGDGPLDRSAAETAPAGAPELATLCASLARDVDGLVRLARAPVSILVLGDTGTGKEIVARGLHRLSGRTGPFVAVNCGALPAALVESELFGHVRGAFSGAVEDRPGLVRAAQGGTLLLDEVGDLPLAAQPALLRALQEREVTPVGGTRPVKIDVRVVAATHRDLAAMCEDESFRRDLFARLAGHVVSLPPLAERREDLGLLIAALLERGGVEGDVSFTARAARALFLHDWPLNVRELDKCLVSAIVLAEGKPVDLAHLPETVRSSLTRPAAASSPSDESELREVLVGLLREHRGNVTLVAQAMGKARMQIHRWVRRFGLSLADFRQDG